MEDSKKRFMVSLNNLKEIKEKTTQLSKRRGELRQAHDEFELIGRELVSLDRKSKRLHRYLDICNSLYGDDLKKIAKKIIETQENSEVPKDSDFLLYDEIKENFVSYNNKGEVEYCIALCYHNFRHYDLKYIMQRIEEITKLKINEYYLMTGRGMFELSLHLSQNNKKV